MEIGYVGLGDMGGALARRLQLSRKLHVYDLHKGAVVRQVATGSIACESLTDLAAQCEVILLCLPTSDHVRNAVFGENGLVGGLAPGSMILDQTSGDPKATRQMSAELASRSIDFIDAPVSGGAQGAEAGTIAIMVGGTETQFARAQPILSSISSNLHHAGPIGSGHLIKLVNNLVSASQRLLTFEAIALSAKNGMDPRKAAEILVSGGARNAYMERVMLPHVLNGDLSIGFSLGLAHKDVRLACQLGADAGMPMFFGNLAREFYQMCISENGFDAKVDTAALVVDRLAGTSVVPKAGEVS